MSKKTKIFFVIFLSIFVSISMVLIFIVNLIIKKYEKEAVILLPPSEQIEVKSNQTITPEEETMDEIEEIEEEGMVSGPLLY